VRTISFRALVLIVGALFARYSADLGPDDQLRRGR